MNVDVFKIFILNILLCTAHSYIKHNIIEVIGDVSYLVHNLINQFIFVSESSPQPQPEPGGRADRWHRQTGHASDGADYD